MERTPLQDAVDGWLAQGPLAVEELADRAVKAGLVPAEVDEEGFDAEDHIDELLERSDAYWPTLTHTDDEVVVLASTFVDTGMTFTHQVSAEELESETVDEMPDLSVLLWQCRDGLPLDDGSGRVAVDDIDVRAPRLAGPPRWMEAVRPGDLLGFTRTDGVLSVEIVAADQVGDGAAEIEALRDAARGWIGDGSGEEEVPVIMEAMARDPGLFRRPVPPVGDLLVAAGLERRGNEWGWAGAEWQTRRERYEGGDAAVRRLYGFDRCCDRAYDRVEEAWHEFIRTREVDGRALAEDLAHGAVAAAYVHANANTAGVTASFARAAAEAATGRHRAPAMAMLGLAHLRDGDPEAAMEALEAAVRADGGLAFAAGTLALLELDRGNLARAHTLALRDDAQPGLISWIETERSRQARLRPSAGRNDPCPCGSGRKFKRCCANGGPLPLAQRVPLVLQRLALYATGPDGHDRLFGLAVSAAGGHDDVVDAVGRFLQDPFIVDVAVHEGGLGEDYLDQRGPLLAEDELRLLETVLQEPLRLWEITAVTPGESLTLRDTGAGDELTVGERSGSEGREPGELLLARATRADGQPMLFGVPVVVPLRERDRVLRMLDGWADADVLAMWFGSLFLPPRLANREGEELVLRRTTVEITASIDAAVAALDDTYERQEDDLVWHEMTVVDGHDRVVRGVLRLDGDELVVESNSEERQERILTTLDELFDYIVVDDEEVGEPPLEDQDGDGCRPLHVDDMPVEMRVLLEQNVAQYEERWVDESIPALGGLTPRQALDDPTRREDLLALLREMRTHEVPEGAVGMSVDRLEALLGIDRR